MLDISTEMVNSQPEPQLYIQLTRLGQTTTQPNLCSGPPGKINTFPLRKWKLITIWIQADQKPNFFTTNIQARGRVFDNTFWEEYRFKNLTWTPS